MEILQQKRERLDLLKTAAVLFDGEMIKAVVDIRRELIAIDAELHADLEEMLLSSGSSQEDLWGINLYPEETEEDFIEYDSLINIRPRQNNRSRGIEDDETRTKVDEVVYLWIS